VDAAAPGGTLFRGRARATTQHASPGYGATGGGRVLDPLEIAEEAARIEREAEERGYEAGRSRAEAELRVAIGAAAAMAARIEETAPNRTSDVAHAIAELALSVARRILQHEVTTAPSVLCAALEAAVSTINGSPEAHVLLNPAAVEPVREAWEALHGRGYLGKRWLFEGDPNLPPGGCTLHYEHGFVEAGLEAQLEEIGIALDRAIPSLARAMTEDGAA
jgi:flagellar assembly protein FliH